MRYSDGNEALAGDVVSIDIKYQGTVVAAIDKKSYLPGHEHWAILGTGIMVNTDFGGLVHCQSDEYIGEMTLISRLHS